VSARSGECEREEWSCLLGARLKVCSVAERGAGGGHTSPRWSPRGVVDGGLLARGWRGLAALASMPHSVLLRCLFSVSHHINTATAATVQLYSLQGSGGGCVGHR